MIHCIAKGNDALSIAQAIGLTANVSIEAVDSARLTISIVPSETFGSRIRRIRESKELSQVQCAKLAGMSQQTWAKYESLPGAGTGTMKLDTVARIAFALDIDIGEMLYNVRVAY
jgi:DNA-binding transcriptional regulator YiaG